MLPLPGDHVGDDMPGAPPATPPANTDTVRRTARNASLSAIAQVVGKLTTFAWTVVAARALSQADFGVFNYVMSIAVIAAAVSEWSFDVVLVRRASRDHAGAAGYLTETLAWETVVGVPLFAAAGALAVWYSTGAAQAVGTALIVVALFLDMFGDSIRAASAALERQGGTSAALVLQRTLTAVFAIPLLLAGAGVAGLGIALFCSYAIGLVAHAASMRRLGLRLRMRLLTPRGMRSFVRGSWTIGVTGLVTTALSRVDVVILEAFKGSVAVGAYSAAYKLFDTALFVAFSVNGALFPVMSARGDDGVHVRRTLESGLAVMAFFYLPFAAVAAVDAPGVLSVLFGPDYAETSAGSLRWLAFAPMVFAIDFLAGSALTAMGRTGGMLVATVVATAVNVAINLVVIPVLSGTGAALATTLSYLVGAVGTLAFVVVSTGQRPRLLRPLLPAAVAAAGLAAVLAVSFAPTLVELAIGMVLYVGVWLVVAQWADKSQVRFIRQVLRFD